MNISHAIPGLGHCLYCDKSAQDEKLTKEHIVPFGLRGRRYIEAGSCGRCAELTKRIEQDALRSYIRPVRMYLELSKRHKKEAPTTFPVLTRSSLLVDRLGRRAVKRVDVPLDDLPMSLQLPSYPAPGILTGALPSALHPSFGLVTDTRLQADYQERVSRLRWRFGEIMPPPFTVPHEPWMLMLAKIAHCAMMARRRLRFRVGLLSQLILTSAPNLAGYVGGSGISTPSACSAPLHQIRFGHLPHENGVSYIFAEITLFAHYVVPRYLILCGIDASGGPMLSDMGYFDHGRTQHRPFTADYIIWNDGQMFDFMPAMEVGTEYRPDFRETP